MALTILKSLSQQDTKKLQTQPVALLISMGMLEYTDGPVMFAPVGEEAFLVIVADKDTNLGWIRIAIKKNSAKIEKVAAI